jgi:UV DNA damage endonuclease
MFPFASHEEYGYSLEPFASEALEEAGKVAAELGHRLTTHPGQVKGFTIHIGHLRC